MGATRLKWSFMLTLAGSAIWTAISTGQGTVSPAARSADPQAVETKSRSFSSPLSRELLLCTQRGADWLCRSNRSDGHFVPGYIPDLKRTVDNDNFLAQAGAAYALARTARVTDNPRQAAVARQAILTLLLDTTVDLQDSRVRYTTMPAPVVNRIGAAGLLVLAINELPAPGVDLLAQSEQLCFFIGQQQQNSGALGAEADAGTMGGIDAAVYGGEALYGLMCSQRYHAATWKTDIVRRARSYYMSFWRSQKEMRYLPWHTAAYTEAFFVSGEPAFADAVKEMNDWLCGRQYDRLDPRHPLYLGGFMSVSHGSGMPSEPQVDSAMYAMSLVEACRVAYQISDMSRFNRYRESAERCLQFLTTLQYTEANTQHFAEWYRPVLTGAFHLSSQDGNVRIEYTQQALCALGDYINYAGH